VQRAGAVQADQERRAKIGKIESSAKTGMILAIVGVPICCAPLSLVGGAMGLKASMDAKAAGVPRPGTALVAMILACVSVVTFAGVMIMYQRDQKEKAEHMAEVSARLKGKREIAALEKKVACDLVEENLAEKGFGGQSFGLKDVHCDGAFSQDDRRASVADVRFAFGEKHFTAVACLERRSRWFVLKTMESGSCADLPPPAPFTPPGRQLTDAELAADEQKTRDDMAHASAATSIQRYVDKLAKVQKDAAAQAGSESTCAKSTMAKYVSGDTRRKVLTVDYDLLAASAGGGGQWGVLTSAPVAKLLDTAATLDSRSSALTEISNESGPLLVVYKAAGKKVWPLVKGKSPGDKDFSFVGGEFSGWMMVYDVDTGARLCQGKLAFESSEVVDFKKSRFASEKSSAKDAVEGDFRDKFETATTDLIKKTAPDLRLGYKILE
jgi:hypothetical protein